MDTNSPSPNDLLVDHLLLVGPGKGLIFDTSCSPGSNPSSSWYTIHSPQPSILRSFPQGQRDRKFLTADVAYFCQPDGPSVELQEQRMHQFMLTDTESNERTYGVCLSFSHLFDPLQGGTNIGRGGVCPLEPSESVCIQEWGILSVCVLSHHPFFVFLQKALLSLQHFVEHFFGEDLTWNALIHSSGCEGEEGGEGEGGRKEGSRGVHRGANRAVVEIEKWISQLVSMRAPKQGQSALEVELEVDPAVTVAMPPANRFPLLDLSVSQLFHRLGVCSVIEIFKLVLAEQKVILYSADVSFVSECVLVLLSLLYPLQYLFPSIPLLPTSMPTAENLLMVPTPFFIGVHNSFLDKIGASHHPEAWMIDLDSKHFEPPSFSDHQTIPEFPYSILQLQADIRKVLDCLEREGPLEWDEDEQSVVSFKTHTTADDHLGSVADEVDVMIRIAFVEFLFSPEILGCTEQYMCIYRLFTRPVVSIKTTAFIHGYQKSCPATNTEFIKNLIRSQGIEYFLEWSLNPSNSAFNEIRRGIHAVDRLSDKQYHFVHKSGLTIHQVCLYTLSDESLLYQEMLAYKASHASYYIVSSTDLPSDEEEDDSDWEILAANRHINAVELPMSSPSYTSEDHTPFSLGGTYPTHRLLIMSHTPDYLTQRLLGDTDVGVGFYPSPQQLAEAEVHIPSSPIEIVSTSVRVNGDELATPKQSTVDPSPIAVATDTLAVPREPPSPISPSLPNSSKGHSFYPTHSSSVRVTSSLPQSLPPPPGGMRRRIIISSEPSSNTSSCDTSCDGDESEVTSEDSEDVQRTGFLTPNTILSANRKKKLSGSCEYLPPSGSPQGVGPPRAYSVSPTPRGSPVDSYSEDDTVLVTRRRVDTHRHNQQRSFFNLSPTPSREFVEFSTPLAPSPSSLGRSHSMRLSRERNPSPRLNSSQLPIATMSRTVPLSAITHTQTLEYQIHELVQKLIDGQGLPLIKPQALRRMAGHEKTRVMVLRQLETQLGVRRLGELKMAIDSQILPVGVTRAVYKGLLDLLKYFLQSIEDELQKEPEASIFSIFLILRLAISVFLLPKGGKAKPPLEKSRQAPDPSLSFLPPISMAISPAFLTPGKTIAVSNSPNRSPVMPRRNIHVTADEVTRALHQYDREITPIVSTGHYLLQEDGGDPTITTAEVAVEMESEEARDGDVMTTPKKSVDANDVSVYYTPSDATPLRKIPNPNSSHSHSHSESHSKPTSSGSSSTRPGHIHKPGSPLVAMHRRLRSEANLTSIRDYTYDKDTPFLYKDLTKALGSGGKAFLLERKFWNVLFMSVVTVERSYLGWNENTSDLYQRYSSLSEGHRQAFGADEDYLLSLILHNLLVYMLALGRTPGETTDIIHRLTARTRLATVEEKQLQKAIRLVEQNGSSELDLSDIGLMALYSEVHPTVSYIIHYGINMIAPVYKLQITSECLILRRFPDERISSRLWNDRISIISNNDRRATVTIHYHDSDGECKHHFHSKEFLKVYESLQILVSVGQISS